MRLQPRSADEKSSAKSGARLWMEARIGSTKPVTQAGLGVAVGGRVAWQLVLAWRSG